MLFVAFANDCAAIQTNCIKRLLWKRVNKKQRLKGMKVLLDDVLATRVLSLPEEAVSCCWRWVAGDCMPSASLTPTAEGSVVASKLSSSRSIRCSISETFAVLED